MGDFTKLQIWSLLKDLCVAINHITNIGAFSKDYDLKSQIRRAAVSIPSNIAEDEESGSNPQSIRFFNIAKGSSAELRTQILIAKEIGYLSDNECEKIYADASKISAMLTKLIQARKLSTPNP